MTDNTSPMKLLSKVRQTEQNYLNFIDKATGYLHKYQRMLECTTPDQTKLLTEEISKDLEFCKHAKASAGSEPPLEDHEYIHQIEESLLIHLKNTKPLSLKTVNNSIRNAFSALSVEFSAFLQNQKYKESETCEKWKSILASIENKHYELLSQSKSEYVKKEQTLKQEMSTMKYRIQELESEKLMNERICSDESSPKLSNKKRKKKSVDFEIAPETLNLKNTVSNLHLKIKNLTEGIHNFTRTQYKKHSKTPSQSSPTTNTERQKTKQKTDSSKNRLKSVESALFLGRNSPKNSKSSHRKRHNKNKNSDVLRESIKKIAYSKDSKPVLVEKNAFKSAEIIFQNALASLNGITEEICTKIENKLMQLTKCRNSLLKKTCLVEYQFASLKQNTQIKISQISKLKKKKKEADETNACLTEELNKAILDRENLQEYYDRKLSESHKNMKNTQENLTKLEEKLFDIQENATNANSKEIETMRTQLEELQTQNKAFHETKEKNTELESKLKSREGIIENLKNFIKCQEESIDSITYKLKDRNLSVDLLKEKDQKIDNLLIDLNDALLKIEELTIKLEHRNRETEHIETELKTLKVKTEIELKSKTCELENMSALNAQFQEELVEIRRKTLDKESLLESAKLQDNSHKNQKLEKFIQKTLRDHLRKLLLSKKSIADNFNLLTRTMQSEFKMLSEGIHSFSSKIAVLEQANSSLSLQVHDQHQKLLSVPYTEELISKVKYIFKVESLEELVKIIDSKVPFEFSREHTPLNFVSETFSGYSSISLPSEINNLHEEIQEEQRLVHQHEQQIRILKLYIIDLENALNSYQNSEHIKQVLIKFIVDLPKLNSEGEDMAKVILAMQGCSGQEIKQVEELRNKSGQKFLRIFSIK